ncbi:MAG TPA: class I adenylate cyclase [Spirochaetota bacterium]|nr:class I adenylate cyclase [Spirochaetota bacterium]HPJ34903.1 class I adenylate cyclase [Spirochaetota bacterium]
MDIKSVIDQNYNFFIKFNDLKYQRFQSLITNSNVKKVINAIPALLCMNDRRIPGYIEGGAPCGVSGYAPDQDVVRYIRGRFSVDYSPVSSKPFIEMLSLMGSVGTIAYNKKSDFDYWAVVDRNRADKKKYAMFCRKIEDVQRWAIKEAGAEVHIFINEIHNLKQNIFAEDDEEGFGSTVGAVLKDEFFRSSIIVSGKIPFWWVVPKFADDSEYEKIFNSIPDEDRDAKYIDIGNLYEISKDDFLGAALFQLIKAIGNPFKSILKIGILERYLFSDDMTLLLSHKVKTSILRGDADITTLDSYLMMFNEVYRYYEEVLDDRSLLKILRQNLYLKIDPQLIKYASMKDRKNLPYKVLMMFRVVNEWGWTIDDIRDLDDFESWDYNRIIQFWNSIKKFMLLSYQKISREMPHLNLKSKISDTDFKLLSSKLKANFSIEPDKIENFITFKDTPNEPYLYIEPDNAAVRENSWKVYKKNRIDNRNEREISIKTEEDLVKLLSWCAINQLYEPTFSRIFFESGYNYINKNLVIELLNRIFEMFNSGTIHLGNSFFLQPPRTMKNMIIMNFTESNATSIESFYHLYMNTWGESFLKKYNSQSDLVMIFSKIIKDSAYTDREFDEFCFFFSPEPHRKIYRGVEKIFRSAHDFFMRGKQFYNQRLLTVVDNTLVCVTREEDELTVASFNTIFEMLGYVSQRPFRYPELRIYSEDSPNLAMIDEIYGKRLINGVTLVHEDRQKYTVFYVMDENSNIFTFIKKKNGQDLMAYMYRFCLNALKRAKSAATGRTLLEEVACFRLDIDRFGKYNLKDESRNMRQMDVLNTSFDEAVMADVIYKDGHTYYMVKKGGVKAGPVQLAGLHDKIKSAGIGVVTPPEILDLKFHNLPHEKAECGTMFYFMEKFRMEKVTGASL